MADIHEKLLDKYGIDINQINIPKLYKVDSDSISAAELEEKIASTKKKWQQNIESGTNEKFVERDRNYLAQSETFEKILRDKKLLRDLIAYYEKGGATAGSSDFVREYFAIVATTKKIKKEDVDFFFEYFPDERKNKKAIVEMLSKDFKVLGLGKDKNTDDDTEKEEEGKKKKENSPLIVNRFEKATLLNLRKAISYYELAANSPSVRQKYPKINESLYDFLEIKEDEELKQFAARVSKMREQAFALRQEFEGFKDLVDFFNKLSDVLQYRDIVDNFTEFKLLIKYPKLTPYMYEFEDMKQDTLKKLFEIANRDYRFRDLTDFILSYFKVVYDNFNIHDQGIKGVIKKAEKQTKKNKILNAIDEKTGRNKRRKVPVWVNIIHWLIYWPIFAFYLVFETAKAVITEVWKFAIPVFVGLFVGSNWLFPKVFGIVNLLALGKLFSKAKWMALVTSFLNVELENNFYLVTYSLITILLLLIIYILPSFLVADFIYRTSKSLTDLYDWIGLERTFKNIIDELRKKTERQFQEYKKKLFVKKNIGKIVINLVCVGLLAAIIFFTPKALRWFSESTGWGQTEVGFDSNYTSDKAPINEESSITQSVTDSVSPTPYEEEPEIIMVITAGTANIRKGPSADTEKVTTATEGTVFIGTGRTEIASNGGLWYEIYLNADKTETAWASEKIIKIQE